MNVFEISGTLRGTGKTEAKKIRNAGEVPAVIYGEGAPQHISVKKIEIEKAITTPETFLMKLNIGGKVEEAILRDAQFHKVNDEVIHLDFLRVPQGKDVEVELPVKLVGTAQGALEGGKVIQLSRRIRVKGQIAKIPARVEVDITSLGMGKTIRVNEVTVEGFTLTSPAMTGIAMVEVPRSAKTAEPEKK